MLYKLYTINRDLNIIIINGWLSKCAKLRQLDQNFDYTIRCALKYSAKNGNRPLKFDTLKLKNKKLDEALR